MPEIEKVIDLAAKFRPSERNLTLYFADFITPPGPDCLHRVFGAPVGMTADDWPTYLQLGELLQAADCLDQWDPCDARMEHVCTVDLRGLDLVGVPTGACAMMLFLSNATYHRADRIDNLDTTVVFLGEEELARGLYRGPLPRRSQHRWSRRFSLVPVDVPGDVFDHAQPEGGDPLLRPLFDAIHEAPARLGGRPIGAPNLSLASVVRHPPQRQLGLTARPSFLMQFRRRFADINLGHGGTMVVHGRGAWLQPA